MRLVEPTTFEPRCKPSLTASNPPSLFPSRIGISLFDVLLFYSRLNFIICIKEGGSISQDILGHEEGGERASPKPPHPKARKHESSTVTGGLEGAERFKRKDFKKKRIPSFSPNVLYHDKLEYRSLGLAMGARLWLGREKFKQRTTK